MARCAALVLAVVVCAAMAAGIAAASPQTDHARAKDALQEAKARLAGIQDQIERIRADLAVQARRVDASEAELDATITELFGVRDRLVETQERHDAIVERLNDRAVEAFISGPGSSLDYLLGATSLTDLSDRMQYLDAVAGSDADLAAELRMTESELLVERGELERLRERHRQALDAAEAVRDEVVSMLAHAQELEAERERVVRTANARYRKALRAYQRSLEPPPVAVGPLPSGYAGVLRVCPVGQPRSYWDGFGAPRYAGGYHLHKGVDMLAPAGTPIFAPFDGVARTDSNSLGGNVVFVDGADGRVYNAHLSAYSARSDGPVRAGDVIGYVGDTGDAIGTPHLHFEFHPRSMPPAWPASSYGYSIIEDAINPYPLLVHACG